MRYFDFIFIIMLFVTSCVTREGNIEDFDGEKVEVEYNNIDTLAKHFVSLYLSTDREYNLEKIKTELKITTPQGQFFVDTITIFHDPMIKKMSGVSENVAVIYENAVFSSKGKYIFEIKPLDIETKFLFKGGVIIK
ncbi:MAG: hypothetical protein IMY73_05365 [Bacteroidetes bacterium]|nr:hypothetical protein [Bacteroidota bacterium]